MAERKIPMRKCTGCGQMVPKKELIRVLLTPEDEVVIDLTGKKNGRGAYVCRNITCFRQAVKTKGFERSLKAGIPLEVFDALEKELMDID